MFKIYDGRKEFYQWDLDRKLIVSDKTISEVHFCNRLGGVSIIRYVYEVNGMYLVDVPNLLLQESFRMNVYGYDKNYTKHSMNFNIVARTRPENYIYTDEDIQTWKELEARVQNIEEAGISDGVIDAGIQKYLEEHPIEVDLTGYATEEFVNEAIGAIDIPEVDLSNHYTKAETDKAIEDAVGAIVIPDAPEADLSNYYTKAETNTAISQAISAIPGTDLSNYYTKSETNTAIQNAQPNLAPYALKTEIPDVSGFTTMGAVEQKGYQTEAQVNSLINTALGVIENGSY